MTIEPCVFCSEASSKRISKGQLKFTEAARRICLEEDRPKGAVRVGRQIKHLAETGVISSQKSGDGATSYRTVSEADLPRIQRALALVDLGVGIQTELLTDCWDLVAPLARQVLNRALG